MFSLVLAPVCAEPGQEQVFCDSFKGPVYSALRATLFPGKLSPEAFLFLILPASPFTSLSFKYRFLGLGI